MNSNPMKVLVTGATGFIGSRLVHRLYREGHQVCILRRESSDISDLAGLELRHFIGDITRPSSLYDALDGMDAVFHNAGLVAQGRGFKDKLYKINVIGTRNILEAALLRKVKRIVVVSSIVAIGATRHPEIIDENFPFNLSHLPYAHSKWLLEKEVERACKKGLDAVIVNPATVYGAGDRHLTSSRSLLRLKRGQLPGYPPGGVTLIDVEDVVSGQIAALEKGRTGERYILGNEHLSFYTLLNDMAEAIGVKPPKILLPAVLLKAAGWVKELLSKYVTKAEPYPSLAAVEMSLKFTYFSSNKAERELGFIPRVDFKTSVKNAYRWYIENGFIN